MIYGVLNVGYVVEREVKGTQYAVLQVETDRHTDTHKQHARTNRALYAALL